MQARILTLVVALVVLAAACGSPAAEGPVTAGDIATDEAQLEGGAVGDATSGAGAAAGGAAEDRAIADGAIVEDGVDLNEVAPGSDGDRSLVEESTGPVGALLFADTIEGPRAPSSARFEGQMLIVGAADSDLPGSFQISVSGAFDIPNMASDITIDMGGLIAAAAEADGNPVPAGMRDVIAQPMQVIVVEEMGWLKWPALSLLSGSGNADLWIELGANEVDDATESFGFESSAGDPTAMLEQLADAEASVEDLGVETVNGVEARHWRALLDLEALAADASPAERAELEQQFGDLTATSFPVDVWVGVADGYIYRYVLELAGDAVLADEASAGGDVESVTVSFDFFGYNADQGISPPPAELITSGDELFGGFADSLGN